jgi:hypothetical protein
MLITTCQKLHHVISKVDIFSELSLIKYYEKTNDIISQFERNLITSIKLRYSILIQKSFPSSHIFSYPHYFPMLPESGHLPKLGVFMKRMTHMLKVHCTSGLKTLETFPLPFDWPSIRFALKSNTLVLSSTHSTLASRLPTYPDILSITN